MVRQFFWFRIGNGESTYVWYDNWCAMRPLIDMVSTRSIHREGFSLSDKVSNLVEEGFWRWPVEWNSIFHSVQFPSIQNHKDDEVWIKDLNGKFVQFSVKDIWHAFRTKDRKVTWCNVVWYPNCIPKHAFLLWLIIKNRLKTQDKVRYWETRTDVSQVCPFCDSQPDSHDHLFFRCSFSLKVWKGVCDFAKIESYSDFWGDILVKYESLTSCKAADVVTAKLVLAACCYLIWQERNLRLFKNQKRDCNQIIEAVVGIVRLKLLSSRLRSGSRKWMEVWKLPNATLEV
ncbi:uncharacterized protein LOC143610868 [Bidens hawaiensis]|uniref:uncharacterized protein LOC143610868 n=1 Tax=Bidens hawaiensis TaxID=980011 RepID=UPI00404A414F